MDPATRSDNQRLVRQELRQMALDKLRRAKPKAPGSLADASSFDLVVLPRTPIPRAHTIPSTVWTHKEPRPSSFCILTAL